MLVSQAESTPAASLCYEPWLRCPETKTRNHTRDHTGSVFAPFEPANRSITAFSALRDAVVRERVGIPCRACFSHAWLNRPELDGKPDETVPDDAPRTAHTSVAAAGGGVLVSGHLIAGVGGRLTAVEVIAHPDPAAGARDKSSRRVVLKPKRGKQLSVAVELFAWDGKRWKSRRKSVLTDVGGFVSTKELQTYEIWLSPHVLDIPPFTTVAVANTGLLGKKPLWNGAPPPEGEEPPAPSGIDVSIPSTWTSVELK